jgi:uncharacterized protein with von Willebrand factor type A (vWA) domain
MSDETAFVELLVQFGRELRSEGLPIGSGEVTTFCNAVTALNSDDVDDLYWCGRSTLVARQNHIGTYDHVFRRFFLSQSEIEVDEGSPSPSPTMTTHAVLQIPDSEIGAEASGDEEEAALGLVASDAEIARDKSFSACTPEELVALRRIMARIRLTPPQRRSRRRCTEGARRRPDMRRMARETMRMRHEPPVLHWAGRKLRIRPLVFILDVSGSMSDYSRNLLQFAYSSGRAAGRVEVFCFGTRLTRITPALDLPRLDDALAEATRRVSDWDGGTQIGESLKEFVQHWARRGTSRGSIVVICSDGHDRGDPSVLAGALEQLSRLSHRIVWMNPHKGDDEMFHPNSLGMTVATRFVDTVVSCHSLRSLEDFAAKLPELR